MLPVLTELRLEGHRDTDITVQSWKEQNRLSEISQADAQSSGAWAAPSPELL